MGKPTTVTLSDLENFLSSRRSAPPAKSKPIPESMQRGDPEAMDRVRAVIGGFTGLGEAPSVMTPGANELYDRSELAGMLSNLVPGKAALSGLGAGILRRSSGWNSGLGVLVKAARERGLTEDQIAFMIDRAKLANQYASPVFSQHQPELLVRHFSDTNNLLVPLSGKSDIDAFLKLSSGSKEEGLRGWLDSAEDVARAKQLNDVRPWHGGPEDRMPHLGVERQEMGDMYAGTHGGRHRVLNSYLNNEPTIVELNDRRNSLGDLRGDRVHVWTDDRSGPDIVERFSTFAKGGPVTDELPRGIARAAGALRRAEEERQMRNSVFNQPRESEWQPDHLRPGGHALEPPMISPDDLLGTGIPTKIAMAIKGAAPMLAGLGVIKNKGGNWLTGSVEGALGGLKKGSEAEAVTALRRARPEISEQQARDFIHANQPGTREEAALNSFIDKQLTRYVKNEMATPEDPIRALAERGVLHFAPDWMPEGGLSRGQAAGLTGGKAGQRLGKSRLAQDWEDLTDQGLNQFRADELSNAKYTENPWLTKLARDTPVYEMPRQLEESLGFSHLTDELSNALNPESGLPRHLLLDPKSMDRVSVPQVVERVNAINQWRAAQKAEADARRANNTATQVFKEYAENNPLGLRWVELRKPTMSAEDLIAYKNTNRPDPNGWKPKVEPTDAEIAEEASRQALADALKYEGDTMGHCVGGYCDDVASGRSRIYSLRDAKGQPHVTVESIPGSWKRANAGDIPDPTGEFGSFAELVNARRTGNVDFDEVANRLAQELGLESPLPRIVQIKGKQNRAPNEEYLPFVQDFVKSGKWSDVGDLQNTGLTKHPTGRYVSDAEAAALAQRHFGDVRMGNKPDDIENPWQYANRIRRYDPDMLSDTDKAFLADWEAGNFASGGPVDKNNLSVQQLQAIIQQLRTGTTNA